MTNREFFYSGIDARFRLNTTLLENNSTYIKEITKLINETLPVWMEKNHAYPVEKKVKRERRERREKKRGFLADTTQTIFNYGEILFLSSNKVE